MPVEPTSVPDFDDLPKVEGMPQGCAWGVFDRHGKKDLVGTLNFLTPSVMKAAAAEVKDGVSISLNWPLSATSKLGIPGRKAVKHNVIYLPDAMEGMPEHASSWDDELEFNTQGSSHKQSLAAETAAENKLPTLDHWHAHGGIAGRGVLLDYKAYAEDEGIAFHPMGGSRITVDELEACAKHFGVEFRPGDVLIVRTGATEVLDHSTPDDLQKIAGGLMSGLHGCEDTARWLWNKRFAAAASDSFAFEACPPLKPDGTIGGSESLVLHHYMLSLFGMSIGEFWDLSKLSQYCKKTNRYSFMITSIPLHHPCLIGSPPNALAIF
ncbi:Uncharacterized protein TPAR_03518 [Tolypocladium paradoxum]|uniref:Cyclase n=1 Tax=Tolypocladium paradoxum TaxID=94208 RepID=A0A2S4L1G3_9HYPO|nr:Uncharacterized protein TPAR_03518 [Tolypocladium paradoxum]